jgi:hypothetical protein
VGADGIGTVASRETMPEAREAAKAARHNLRNEDPPVRVFIVKSTSRRLKKVSP